MSGNCPFQEGDAVEVAGVCGKVVARLDQPGGTILRVLPPGGGVVAMNCAQAQPCTHGAATSSRCGAATLSSAPCKRQVVGHGRCHLHRG